MVHKSGLAWSLHLARLLQEVTQCTEYLDKTLPLYAEAISPVGAYEQARSLIVQSDYIYLLITIRLITAIHILIITRQQHPPTGAVLTKDSPAQKYKL